MGSSRDRSTLSLLSLKPHMTQVDFKGLKPDLHCTLEFESLTISIRDTEIGQASVYRIQNSLSNLWHCRKGQGEKVQRVKLLEPVSDLPLVCGGQ